MNDQDLADIEKALSAKYVLVRKGRLYYGIGGAIAAIVLITGISVQSVREAVSGRIQGEVADAVSDVESRLAELDALADAAVATVQGAEAELEAIRAASPGTTRTIHDDAGNVISERGRGGSMIVTLGGQTDGRPSSTPVDHGRLTELCNDLDGCGITVTASPFLVDMRDGQTLPALFAPGSGGPCRFYMRDDGHWSLENGCVLWRQRIEIDPNDGSRFLEPNADGTVIGFRPYNSASGFGIDGDATVLTDGTQVPNGLVVIAYSSVCMFSEMDVNLSHRSDETDPRFRPDDAIGFHLVMAGVNWSSYPNELFPVRDPDRLCVLIVQD